MNKDAEYIKVLEAKLELYRTIDKANNSILHEIQTRATTIDHLLRSFMTSSIEATVIVDKKDIEHIIKLVGPLTSERKFSQLIEYLECQYLIPKEEAKKILKILS